MRCIHPAAPWPQFQRRYWFPLRGDCRSGLADPAPHPVFGRKPAPACRCRRPAETAPPDVRVWPDIARALGRSRSVRLRGLILRGQDGSCFLPVNARGTGKLLPDRPVYASRTARNRKRDFAPGRIAYYVGANIQRTRHVIAVIFEVWPAEGRSAEYLDLAGVLRADLDITDGFI